MNILDKLFVGDKKIKAKKILKIVGEIVFLSLLLFLLGLYGINQLMSVLVHGRKSVMVPNLMGKTVEEAVDILSEENLYLKKEAEQYSSSMPPGYIIFQSPSAGNTMKEKRVVKVIISQGGEVVFVPDTVSKGLRSAEIILREAGLSLGEQTREYSIKIPRDSVISQDPLPHTTVEKGMLVNLVVSDGPPQEGSLLMPDIIGKNIKEAMEILQQWNLIVEKINREEENKYAVDTVIAQSPQPDTLIGEDDKKVFLTISIKEGTKVSSLRKETKFIYYEISQGMFDKHLRMILVDDSGERTVYDKIHPPGTKINIPVEVVGKGKVKIYVNDILMVEKDL
ncbi:PASTA domain-containing protein [bacterium]|nr:PASTA domain-containing protein [bacterium]